ncbi:hypothetical protein Tco_0400376 [Tanacetum coccineum]
MWEAIKTRNLGADRVKEARLQTIITKFENLKMSDNDTINAYAAKLSALEQVLDLKTTGFEDVVGRLKAYEERVKEEDKTNDPQENLLYARTEYSNGNNDSSKGRGRSSYSRGRERGRGQGREKYTPPKSESNTDDEDDVWYFDNGSSNHMTGNYSYFSELDENIIRRVRFGDGSCVSIKGKGLILFQGKNGEQKLLKDVYYIPALRSNVISLRQATISGYVY